MIKVIDGNLFDTEANFIVHSVNCCGVMGSGVAKQVRELYPHVEREYMKFVKHCSKSKVDLLGSAQYVPTESWALVMVDPIKNNNVIAYDNKYQYIVNLFGQRDFGSDGKMYTSLNALKNGLLDIRKKAEQIGATVALPYGIGSVRGGAEWSDVLKIIKEVFEKSSVNVEIRRLNMG